MVNVKLMRTRSAPNTLNKKVEILSTVSCNIKEPIDVDNPVLYLSGDIANINYFQIEAFGQYYFADPLKPTGQNNIFELTGHVDPLMSNKAELLNLKGIVSRVTNNTDAYIVDDKLPLSVKPSQEVISFPHHFHKELTYVLITSG